MAYVLSTYLNLAELRISYGLLIAGCTMIVHYSNYFGGLMYLTHTYSIHIPSIHIKHCSRNTKPTTLQDKVQKSMHWLQTCYTLHCKPFNLCSDCWVLICDAAFIIACVCVCTHILQILDMFSIDIGNWSSHILANETCLFARIWSCVVFFFF